MLKDLAFVILLCAYSLVGAGSAVEKQLQERKDALRKLERELREQREQVENIEVEEKGVLNTISLIDQNLNQTREYLTELGRNEAALGGSITTLQTELDSLNHDISAQQSAMRQRIRELYMKGRGEKWEQIYRLLRLKDNPDRQIYLVRRLLEDDRNMVDKMQASVSERDHKRSRLVARLDELQQVRASKAREEEGLKGQLSRQSDALNKLQHDKETQKRALAEYERNQKTMMALINALETKRKRELAEAAKRKKAAQKKQAEKSLKAKKGKSQQAPPPPARIAVEEAETPVAIGPKCVPLKGEIVSEYGYHEHKVLHTMTRNLGTEIRGHRGESVKAAAAGTVVMVTRIDGRGPSVIVDHGGSLYTVYGHMASVRVREGQELRHCQDIGDVGDAESLNGYKLYFQVSKGTHTLDPMTWLRSSP